MQEGNFYTTNIPVALLVPSDNVVAVEVHQVNNTSSDIVLGMALFGVFTTFNSSPLLLTQPAGRSVTSGANVTFTAAADGTAPLTYKWYKDAALVPGATGLTLTLNNVQSADAGAYTFVASNSFGSATSLAANLIVIESSPPSITAAPLSQIEPVGANVTFTVAASGNGLGYQWLFNSNNLANATTASLTLPSVTPSQSGFYSVIVSNSAGRVTSASAQLFVVPLPSPGVAPQFQPIAAGEGPFNLSFTTSPGYHYLVQYIDALGSSYWLTLTNIAPSFDGAQISLPQNSTDAPQRFYRVTVPSVSAIFGKAGSLK